MNSARSLVRTVRPLIQRHALPVLVHRRPLTSLQDPPQTSFDEPLSADDARGATLRLLPLLRAHTVKAEDVVETSSIIRYWTMQRTPSAVKTAWELYQHTVDAIASDPDLLESSELAHWYTGNYPRATHLLAAILDSWRIVYETGSNQVLDPPSMAAQLLWLSERGVPLSNRCFAEIMAGAMRRGRRTETPEFCQGLLSHMLQLASDTSSTALLPDTVTFTTVLQAWAQSGRPDAGLKAQQLLLEMQRLHDERLVDAAPTTVTYNTVLHALTCGHQPALVQRAQEVLEEMRHSPYPSVSANGLSYRLVLFRWLGVGDTVRARRLLDDLIRADQSGQETELDATYFSKLISHLAKAGDAASHEQAEQVYQRLLELYQSTGQARFEPEVYTTRAMLILYAKLQRPADAEMLLQRLEKQASLARQQGHLTTASAIMPKRGHYHNVLLAWTKAGEPERAERVLLRMMDVASQRGEAVLVDRHGVDSVLGAWAESGREDAGEQAEALLRQLQRQNQQDEYRGERGIPMSRSSYFRVIKSWANVSKTCRDAAERAHALLVEMNEHKLARMRPTIVHYTAVANIWARSKRPEALSKMKSILDIAVQSFQAGNKEARPDTKLYCAIIHGCSLRGDGQGAELVLRQLLHDRKNGNDLVRATASEFNLALLAWLRSKDSEAPDRALALFDLMEASNVRPNERSRKLLAEILPSRDVKVHSG